MDIAIRGFSPLADLIQSVYREPVPPAARPTPAVQQATPPAPPIGTRNDLAARSLPAASLAPALSPQAAQQPSQAAQPSSATAEHVDPFPFIDSVLQLGRDDTPRPLSSDVQALAPFHEGSGSKDPLDLSKGLPDPASAELARMAAEKAKLAAKLEILVGDQVLGNGLLNTRLESAMLHHWVQGSGETYELSARDMEALSNSGEVREVQDFFAKYGPEVASQGVSLSSRCVSIERVTLEDEQPGYRVELDFNNGRKANETFDGSIGKARVYFDDKGKLVGVLDSYDFSNKNVQVDVVNLNGALAGAKNFEVRGGIIEACPDRSVPDGPDGLLATSHLAKRGGEWVGRQLDSLGDAIVSGLDSANPFA